MKMPVPNPRSTKFDGRSGNVDKPIYSAAELLLICGYPSSNHRSGSPFPGYWLIGTPTATSILFAYGDLRQVIVELYSYLNECFNTGIAKILLAFVL